MTYSAFLKELKRLKAANRESIIKKYPKLGIQIYMYTHL